jgi:YidC/Oxa1 family membrane protein insertase
MERRALIAVVISLVILVVYQEVVLRYVYPPPARQQEEANLPPPNPEAPAPPAHESAPELAAPPAAPAVAGHAAEARHVTVDTELYTAVFTSLGARLESFRLKKYRTTVDHDSPPQETIVPGEGGDFPFGVELRGRQSKSDSGAAYRVSGDRLDLKGDATGTLEFTWESDSGTVVKRFAFRGDRYEFDAVVGARNLSSEYTEIGVTWDKGIQMPPQPGSEVLFNHVVYLDGKKLFEETFDKLSAGKVVVPSPGNSIGWVGYSGQHFLAAMIPIDDPNYRVWLKQRDHTAEAQLLFPVTPSPAEHRLAVYIGPKDVDALEGVGHALARAVNLGWFDFIALPLLHLLKFLDGFTRNYGVAIILLTVGIKVLFIPLTQRSFRSMREMQKLQPQMAKIRERFKDDSEQMNKEIMELYRRHKVNPLGGCLPMVLQIPVFIGLYQALLNSVELRHAPFMLWINDLSAPDRLGSLQLPFVQHPGIPVLTLLMGGSMFVQQWMTPSAGDPTQQRAMMIMPLMFTFMFVNFPSGLALYWLVNNLLTIAQQYYMNRTAT